MIRLDLKLFAYHTVQKALDNAVSTIGRSIAVDITSIVLIFGVYCNIRLIFCLLVCLVAVIFIPSEKWKREYVRKFVFMTKEDYNMRLHDVIITISFYGISVFCVILLLFCVTKLQ